MFNGCTLDFNLLYLCGNLELAFNIYSVEGSGNLTLAFLFLLSFLNKKSLILFPNKKSSTFTDFVSEFHDHYFKPVEDVGFRADVKVFKSQHRKAVKHKMLSGKN